MSEPLPPGRLPLRVAGSLNVTHGEDRLTITGEADRVIVATDSLTLLNELRKTLQSLGKSKSSDSDSSKPSGRPFDLLKTIDVTVEVHLKGERIARFGPGAKTNLAAKAFGLKDAELSVKHFVKATLSRS